MPTTEEILLKAWNVHQQGNPTQAEQVYRSVLEREREMRMLGVTGGSPYTISNSTAKRWLPTKTLSNCNLTSQLLSITWGTHSGT